MEYWRLPRMLIVIGLLCLTGCGSGNPETVPVSGKVTLEGGPWPKPGMLFFTPIEEVPGFPMRPATADFDVDGLFRSATTYEAGDGVLPGKYRVRVECWEQAPNMEGKPVKSHVPSRYDNAATSGLEATIGADADPQRLSFNVQQGTNPD